MDESLDTWFKREVLIHESALLRYLNRVWPARSEIQDLRQEIYIRVYEAARKSRPAAVRAFLLTTARNLLADRHRHARVISIDVVSDPDALNVLVDEISAERRAGAWQDLKRVIGALNRLPPKCREVVWLRRVDALSTKEIAHQLNLSVRTVENQVFRGMKALSEQVFSAGVPSAQDGQREEIEEEDQHGER